MLLGTKTVLTDTNQIIQEMQSGKFFALRAEGDFGNAIRDEIYKRNGFTKLKGNTYPHHDQTWGIFPGPFERQRLLLLWPHGGRSMPIM